MLESLYSGVSGMLSNQDEMDVIGNNIANSNTTAFKAGTAEFTESFTQEERAPTASQPVGITIGLGAEVSAITTNFTQGTFQTTNVPTDMGINGNGFFTVQSIGGTNYVTRNGAFVEDSKGYLRTSSGDYLMGVEGDTAPTSPTAGFPTDKIQIPTEMADDSPVVSFAIASNGAITITGADGTTAVAGYITLQSYANDDGLVDDGGGNYSYDPAAGTNQYYVGGEGGAGTIQTGVLEASNVDLSTEFTNMIMAQEGYTASARVISVSSELLQTATSMVQGQ